MITCDEWPNSLPPSPCSAHLTCLHTPALAHSIPACPVSLAVGPSTLLSPTHCSSHLTCPGLLQSIPSALPASHQLHLCWTNPCQISHPFQMMMILATCLGGPPGEEMARPIQKEKARPIWTTSSRNQRYVHQFIFWSLANYIKCVIRQIKNPHNPVV